MIGKIAWKNIIHKPLNTTLCISLMMFGVGIITLLLLIQHQLEQKFQRDLRNIDMVVGAKGSPLQLVLSAIYHMDAPTGNISFGEARKIMENPLIQQAIPLAYGDSYQGYRILGTTRDYMEKYDAELQEGRVFSKAMETTLGANVAVRSNLNVGDTFFGTHGNVKGGHVHDNHPYKVVGILEVTNTVLDNLVLSNIESVWQVHSHIDDEEHTHDHEEEHAHEDEEEHAHEEEEHDKDEEHIHDHEEEHAHEDEEEHAHEGEEEHVHKDDEEHIHDHEEEHAHEDEASITDPDSMEITAILLKCKSKMSVLSMPRTINEQTNMQAALPAIEINRLFHMLGIGATTLRLIAYGIMIMAGFSMFFVMYSRLRDRKYELALMRSVGYEPMHLFGLLILEGMLLASLGYVLGWFLSRVGLQIINRQAAGDFNIQFEGGLVPGELWLLLLTFSIGFLSALLPALQAMRMNVSATLSKN